MVADGGGVRACPRTCRIGGELSGREKCPGNMSRGMSGSLMASALQDVFRATVKLVHTVLERGREVCSASECARRDAFLRRSKRYGHRAIL